MQTLPTDRENVQGDEEKLRAFQASNGARMGDTCADRGLGSSSQRVGGLPGMLTTTLPDSPLLTRLQAQLRASRIRTENSTVLQQGLLPTITKPESDATAALSLGSVGNTAVVPDLGLPTKRRFDDEDDGLVVVKAQRRTDRIIQMVDLTDD